MQRIIWILSAAILILAQAAVAAEPCGTSPALAPTAAACPVCASPCPCACHGGCCHSAPAYNLVPGCCEPRRHCFDNAWDGYCEQRAKWDTFCCKFGTGALLPEGCPMHDGRGVAIEAPLRHGAAACQACRSNQSGGQACAQIPTTAR